MSITSKGFPEITTSRSVRSQRAWARVAGLMYWMVLVVDLTGMQLHSAAGTWLMFAGSVLTVPLALGLYYAVRPAHEVLAATALAFRLLEAALGVFSIVIGFAAIRAELAGSGFGKAALNLGHWNDATAFGAFVFTIGSTIFFYVFIKSRYIPRVLAWVGLLASVIAMGACVAHFSMPSFPAMTMYAWMPMALAEMSTGLWLLVKSVKAVDETSLGQAA